MKIKILILFLLLGQVCSANMASPILMGTRTSSAFSSKDIHILSEKIQIQIDKDFKTAKFLVEYTIQSEVIGLQIPLLFYAQDFKDSFFVWVDDQRVEIQNIPSKYTQLDNSPFSMFSNSFGANNMANATDEVTIYWFIASGFVYKFNDLKYFETDLVKGTHKVKIAYTANVWIDNSGWIKEYSFRYSLTPAKFWKSFGNLNVRLEQEGTIKQLSTNIGQPIEKVFKEKNNWTFNKLPAEYLEFSFSPPTNQLARTLIAIDPFGLSIVAGIILLALHLFFVLRYRSKHLDKKYSPIVILGSLLIPLLLLLIYGYSYYLIDNLIGENAGRFHGYVFLVIILYPILLPCYWAILWLFDRWQKRKMKEKRNSQ